MQDFDRWHNLFAESKPRHFRVMLRKPHPSEDLGMHAKIQNLCDASIMLWHRIKAFFQRRPSVAQKSNLPTNEPIRDTRQAIPFYNVGLRALTVLLNEKYGTGRCKVELALDKWLISIPAGEARITEAEIEELRDK
jgi:hypothetical protein